jgi:hypothetical protein
VDRERQISEITARLLDARPDSLRAKLRNIRGFVTAQMRNLRTIMNSDIAHVRAELAKHIEKITVTPSGECYIASGTWNFVGRGSIDGAGARNGPNVCPFGSNGGLLHRRKGLLAVVEDQLLRSLGFAPFGTNPNRVRAESPEFAASVPDEVLVVE